MQQVDSGAPGGSMQCRKKPVGEQGSKAAIRGQASLQSRDTLWTAERISGQ